MKKVNFITTLSPEKQYEIKKWFCYSALLIASSVMIVAYLVVPEIMRYMALKKDSAGLCATSQQHAEALKKRDILKTEYETVRAQNNKLQRFNSAIKNPHDHMMILKQACGNDVLIESVQCNKKDCTITLLCPTAAHATVFITRLSASEKFSDIKLTSLQQDEQLKQLRCMIKGRIKYEKM